MAQPTPFDRQTSFALFTSENPGEPHSGVDLDAEFNAVKLTSDETLANLALIQRDDGTLAAGSVGLDQLDASISLGVRSRGVWVTATAYVADTDTVFHTTKIYLCETDHTSGIFATDLAAGKWTEIADLGVQVLDDDTVGPDELQDDAVTTNKIQNSAVTGAKIATGTITLAKLAASLQEYLVPAGTLLLYGGPTAPSGYLLPYGQVVAQATYPALYVAYGTTYDTGGEGAGNFRMPDWRGRTFTGKLDMGGSSGTAIDTTTFGADPTTLGIAGGVKNTTLLQANLPNVNFTNSGITVGIGTLSGGTVTALGAGGVGGPSAGAVTEAAPSGKTVTLTGSPAITAQGSAASGGSGTAISRIAPSRICNVIVKAH